MLAEAGPQVAGSVVSVDLAAGVHYDVDTGTEFTPYVGVGVGMSHVTVKMKQTVIPRTSTMKMSCGRCPSRRPRASATPSWRT